MTKRIDVAGLASVVGSLYPPPFDEPCRARERKRLGDAAGLTQFGVNLLRLRPGVSSSQRHWHTAQDEFVYVLSGEVTLVTDAGEETLRAGDAAGFKAGEANGDVLADFDGKGALAGDSIRFEGYGQGAYVTLGSGTLSVHYGGGVDVINLTAKLDASDYSFA